MAKKKSTIIESYTLQNGQKRYMFQVYIGTDPLTGKPQRTTRRGFKTKKEAELALARIKLEIDKGIFRTTPVETYEDIYNIWIKVYEKTVEESTFIKTLGIFKNHILPALGSYKISKLNIDVCQKHVNEWSTKLKKFRTVKSYASKVIDFSIKRGYIQTNPFKFVDLPKVKVNVKDLDFSEENFYTREELIEFLTYLEIEGKFNIYVFFRLLSYSGMRKGEALALNWNDINFEDNEIRINKAISRGKNNVIYIKSTKTGTARTIKMDEKTMDLLKEWKNKQSKELEILGFSPTKTNQLVFHNSNNEFIQPTKTREWLISLQKKYNLKKITTHGLRHTHCSLLFEAGASLKEVQDRLGHSDVKTTMDIYTHVTKKAKNDAMDKFTNYLKE